MADVVDMMFGKPNFYTCGGFFSRSAMCIRIGGLEYVIIKVYGEDKYLVGREAVFGYSDKLVLYSSWGGWKVRKAGLFD